MKKTLFWNYVYYRSVSLHHLEVWIDGKNQVKMENDIYVVLNYNMDKTQYYKTNYNF